MRVRNANTLNPDDTKRANEVSESLISEGTQLVRTDESESGMCYKTLYDVDYFFRIMTKSIFEPGNKKVVFDVILPNSDPKLQHFHLFSNCWRETILI